MDSGIKTIHHDLVSGKRSCYDMVQEKLSLLGANKYHTANLLLDESALMQAKIVDEKIKSGKSIELLEGVPFGIKDVILLQNTLTTGSSPFLKNYYAPYTGTAIQKLMDAGAIPLVKENCDSFGHGRSIENSVFNPILNVHDGASAVNVAKGYTAFSIGTDTGGSIRQTAGCNKIYGLRPTYGRVSRYGMMADMSSTDCIGPLASSLEDIRLLINTMSGKDPNDPTTCPSPMIPESVFDTGYMNKEIVAGYYKSFLEYLDSSVKDDFLHLLDTLYAKGIKIKPLDFFDVNLSVSVFYVLAMAEEASNLARLDGSLYGARAKSSSRDVYMKTRADNFSKETISRIVGGNMALSRENFEEIYLKAKVLRNTLIDRFNTDFKEVDVILSPTCINGASLPATCSSPSTPLTIGSSPDNPLAGYFSDAFTAGFSLGGLPTLTVPFFTSTGIQITSNKNEEDVILHFAHALKEIQ